MAILGREPLDMSFCAGSETARSDQVGCQVDTKAAAAAAGIDKLKEKAISITEETAVRR